MGACKKDILSKGREWHFVTLSNKDSIKGLIKYRQRYDLLFNRTLTPDCGVTHIDLNQYAEEVLCIYADLDSHIGEAALSSRQRQIIQLYQEGYNEREIAQFMNTSQPNISKMMDTICLAISEVASNRWSINIYKNKIRKLKVCNCCNKELPEIDRFFYENYKDNEGNSHYKPTCKSCLKAKRDGKRQ